MAKRRIKLPAVGIKDHNIKGGNKNKPPKIMNPNDVEESKLAKMLAPIMKLHPDETAFPMNPDRFINISRFRNHRAGKRDKGYNRDTDKWDTSNSHAEKYFNIPVRIINSHGLHGNKKNRRPRDPNSGHGEVRKVFLDPKKEFINGDSNPNGRVDAYYFYRKERLGTLGLERILISYWIFFGANPTPPIAHQGDWAHATILVDSDSVSIEGIWFSRHGIGPIFHPKFELFFEHGRPVVYISKKSHGTFVNPGKHEFEQVAKKNSPSIAKALKKLGISDLTANGGIAWNISLRLLALKNQPWRNYAGAWGEVGNFMETTGPLGPWPKRRNK